MTWDVDALNDAGIVHMTNELYDTEVFNSDQVWLLVFTKGINSTNPYDSMASINERLSNSMIEFTKKYPA